MSVLNKIISITPITIAAKIELDDLEAFERCPVCFSEGERPIVGTLQKSPMVYLLECGYCHAVSSSHLPKISYLDRYYEETFSKLYSEYHSAHDEIDVTFSDLKRFANHIKNLLGNERFDGKERLHIIDVGGGDGALSMALSDAFDIPVDITVVDYGSNLAKLKKPGNTIRKYSNLDEVERPGEIVIASASLEHFPVLYPILTKIHNLIKTGGYFYARTPYVLPLIKVSGGLLKFGFPAHIHDLGYNFWNSFDKVLFKKMKLIKSGTSIIEVSPKKHFVRWLIALLMKFPTRLELKLRKQKANPIWRLCGGWEVLFKKEI